MKSGPSWIPLVLNNDYKEMLQSLNDEGVKYLLVGAYALAAHGFRGPPGLVRDPRRSQSAAMVAGIRRVRAL